MLVLNVESRNSGKAECELAVENLVEFKLTEGRMFLGKKMTNFCWLPYIRVCLQWEDVNLVM